MASKTAEWYKKHGMGEILSADEERMREIIEVAKKDDDVARSVIRLRRDCSDDRLIRIMQIVRTAYGRKVFVRYLMSHAVERILPMRDDLIKQAREKDADPTMALALWDNMVLPVIAMTSATKLALAIIVASDQCIREQSRRGEEMMTSAWSD